jgi:hypothetical protein
MSTGDPNRTGDWFVTYTGKEFYPLDPRVEDFCIEDIAHALALQTRWMGHCKNFYSIASHSMACLKVAEMEGRSEEARQWALMHDAAEAYTGDIVRPIKGHLGMIKPSMGPSDQVGLVPFKVFEEKLLKLIAERFGLVWPIPEVVKSIDNRMLVTEAKANTMYHGENHWIYQKPWQSIKPYANDGVLLWQTPEMAEQAFRDLAAEILPRL